MVQWLGLQALTSEGPGAIPGQGTEIPQLCTMAKRQTKDGNKQKKPKTSCIMWQTPVNPEWWPPESHYFEEDVTFLPQSVTTGIQSTIPSTGLHTFDAKAATNSSNPITNKTAIRIQKDPPKKSIFIYNVFWVLIFFFLILSLCYLCYTEIMADIKSKRYAGVCCLLSAVLVLVHLQ